jgi:hypothetical protein
MMTKHNKIISIVEIDPKKESQKGKIILPKKETTNVLFGLLDVDHQIRHKKDSNLT